jgi:hypothetical protein
MPDSKSGDLGVFDDLVTKKPQDREPSQPLFAEPVNIPPPPAWFGGSDPPAKAEVAPAASEPGPKGPESLSPILAPTDTVDDKGWDDAPIAAPAVPAPASWGEELVPAARSRVPAPPATRLSGVPLPPPSLSSPSNRPKLAPPPTVSSSGKGSSSLAPGSLAPPVLTAPAFTSPAVSAPPPPAPPRMSLASQPSQRAISSDVAQPAAPRRRVSKQALAIAATLVAGVVLGFVVRGSGGSAAGNPTATLKAATGQPGVKLLVDGRDTGPLPREISGLTPGEHVIVFEGDRYVSKKRVLIFGPNEVKELEPEQLKIARGAATFELKTQGASLVLVASDERREVADYSHPVDIDTSKSWTLEASKPGYGTLRMPVTFEAEPSKTFVVTLGESEKREKVEAPSVAQNTAPPEPPKAQVQETPKVEKVEKAQPEPAKAREPVGSCKLNVNSIPVSKVLLDGRPIGLTPRVGVVVPAGSHTVVFVGENGRKSTSSTCQAGETKAVSMHL